MQQPTTTTTKYDMKMIERRRLNRTSQKHAHIKEKIEAMWSCMNVTDSLLKSNKRKRSLRRRTPLRWVLLHTTLYIKMRRDDSQSKSKEEWNPETQRTLKRILTVCGRHFFHSCSSCPLISIGGGGVNPPGLYRWIQEPWSSLLCQ